MIATIKRFICNYWFGNHKYRRVANWTIGGIEEEISICKRCGKWHVREGRNHGKL